METALWRVREIGEEAELVETFATAGEALRFAVRQCEPGDYLINGGANGARPVAFSLRANRDVVCRAADDLDELLARLPGEQRLYRAQTWHAWSSVN